MFNKRNVTSFFIPYTLLLSQYPVFGNVGLGLLILIMFAGVFFLTNVNSIYLPKHLFFFLLIVSFMFVLKVMRGGEFNVSELNILIMAIAQMLTISIIFPIVNKTVLYRSYCILGLLAVCVLIYHSFFIYVLSKPVAPLAILPISEGNIRLWQPAYRPSGLFTEPQAFCSFILPLLLMTILKNNKLLSALIVFSVLLSASSFGYIFLLAYSIWFVFQHVEKLNDRVLISSFVIVVIYFVLQLPLLESGINKIEKTDFSTQIRVAKGFLILIEMNLEDITFGLPSSITQYILDNRILFPWASPYIGTENMRLLEYVTTYSGVFIKYGIVAGAFFSLLLFRMFKDSSNVSRSIFFIILLTSFSATILFNALFIFNYLLFYIFLDKISSNNFYKLKFK